MNLKSAVPIIDIFAGPGGLGEGFASLAYSSGQPVFSIKLSIEKDPIAHRTLLLRAIYRYIKQAGLPESYYDYIKGHTSRLDFENRSEIRDAVERAKQEVLCATLGETSNDVIDKKIRSCLKGETEWVLIGGPPCQAYSLAGRSRMKNINPVEFENDHRHLLYKEYLRIIQEHKPAIFVMENVKGILSSTHAGLLIFEKIRKDLSFPGYGVEYELRSFVNNSQLDNKFLSKSFIIRAEEYGIPQARHRVIILGVRKDLSNLPSNVLLPMIPPSVKATINNLPSIRSHISRQTDSFEKWLNYLSDTIKYVELWNDSINEGVSRIMHEAIQKARHNKTLGSQFIPQKPDYSQMPRHLRNWLEDVRLGGVIQHTSRGHMPSDLQRYLFAASYAQYIGASPKIKQFPQKLLPKHRNINDNNTPFEDRFRVQIQNVPATTIVSHISKDGHYYIHYDPSQCRSLTVREAARLQTFPDNYFFEGNKTEQYIQVGNAVPPLLAKQLAEIIANLLGKVEITTKF